jgi:tetratricopeptide (TPR) repeat protein
LEARFEKLQPLAEKLPDPVTRGLFLNELGLYQLRQGKLSDAAERLRESGELFSKAGDRLGSISVLANQARVYEAQGNFPAAMDAWYAALAGFEAIADPPGIAAALAGLGRSLLGARQDLPGAEDFLRRAAHNFRLLGQRTELAATLEELGKALNLQGKTAAREAIEEELRQLRSGNPSPAVPAGESTLPSRREAAEGR